LFLEQLKRDPAYEQNARLRVFGFGQFCFRPIETNRSEVVAERGVGAVKPRLGAGKFFSKVFAHADDLRALSGKQECGFAHKGRILNTNSRRRESREFGTWCVMRGA
jgi:hypothetical protein